MTVPVFIDQPRMPARVRSSVPWAKASLNVCPSTVYDDGMVNFSSGLDLPSSIRAAAVIIFSTEPGS